MSSLFMIAITTCLHMTAVAQVSKATFDKPITISLKSIRIDSLLKAFSRQTGVEFSFSTNKISPGKTLTVSKQRQTLSQWLNTLRQNIGVEHKVVGNHIILFENKSPIISAPQKSPAPGASKAISNNKETISGQAPPAKVTILADSSHQRQQDTVVQQPTVQKNILPAATTAVSPAATVNTSNSNKQPMSREKPAATPPSKKSAAQLAAAPLSSPGADRSAARERATDAMPNEALQLVLGYSKHGSGDMDGIVFGADYSWYLGRKFSFGLNIRGTINSDHDDYSYYNQTTNITSEASIRSTTAGAQLGLNAQYSIIRSPHHEIMVSLGAYLRYQSTSLDGYSVMGPPITGTPEFHFSFYNWDNQNSISPGILPQLHYNFTFMNNLVLGLKGGIQQDMLAEAVQFVAFTIGKRF